MINPRKQFYIFMILLLSLSLAGLAFGQDDSSDDDTTADETPTVEATEEPNDDDLNTSRYQINSNSPINARITPSTVASVASILQPGTIVTVLDVVEGSLVNGNSIWYRIQDGTGEAFVHSSLLVPVNDDIPLIPFIELPNDLVTTIIIIATGTASASPDTAIIELSFERVGSDAKTVYDNTVSTINGVTTALEGVGVDSENISTTQTSLTTVDVIDSGGGLTGEFVYRSQFIVTVKTSIDLWEQVVETSLTNGANNILRVSYAINDLTDLESKARADSLDRAEQQAIEFAVQTDRIVALGPPISINILEVNILQPVDLLNVVDGGGLTVIPDSPTDITATVQLRVEYITQVR